MDSNYFDYQQVKKVAVSMQDGSTWECAVDTRDGRLIPLRQLQKPMNSATAQAAPTPAPMPNSKMGILEHYEAMQKAMGKMFGGGTGTSDQPASQEVDQEPDDSQNQDGQGGNGATVNTNVLNDLANSIAQPNNITGVVTTMPDNVFRSRMQSVMTDNMYERRLRGSKRGKLDVKHLYKAEVGSTKLFTQKKARRGKEYNFVLCVDRSSSMGSSNYDTSEVSMASSAAEFIYNSFHGLNLNLAVMSFSDDRHVAVGLDEKLDRVTGINKIHRSIIGGRRNGTNDYSAMLKAYELLKNKQGQQNFVIMISDGESGRTDDIQHIVRANEDLATGFGIGIYHECKQMPDHKTIRDINDLKPALLEYMKKNVRRG